jgi:hypothetical protein
LGGRVVLLNSSVRMIIYKGKVQAILDWRFEILIRFFPDFDYTNRILKKRGSNEV